MHTLAIGDQAPVFRLRDEHGREVALEKFLGKQPVVLFFYPGDDTAGCTTQLCAVRDDWEKYQNAGVAVFGVNHADEKSHQRFVDKYQLTVPLLVDEGHAVAKLYDVIKLSMNPLKIHRTVVGISKEGKIIFYQRGMPSTSEILSAITSHPA